MTNISPPIFPRIANYWIRVRSSMWFVPSVIVLSGVLLGLGMIELDVLLGGSLYGAFPYLLGAGAEGSRAMLGAIASSVITVAGVAFSITIVALSLAATQYTSRVLRTFHRDRRSQAVLGVLLGVFAYCIVVLRSIRGGDEGVFVPQLAVLGGVALSFVAIGALIFFIHHIATAIQVSHILAAVAEETRGAIDRLFPEDLGERGERSTEEEHSHRIEKQSWCPIPATRSGYVQAVDADSLVELAVSLDAVIRMECGVGDFVVEGTPLASISPPNGSEKDLACALEGAIVLSRFRTVEQDPAFGIRQIVDMALKALSPGVNDTTTAVMCIDYLVTILSRLARRSIPSPYRFDEGRLRVIARGETFQSLLGASIDQIRQNAEGNVAVIERLYHALGILAGAVQSPARLGAILAQCEAVSDMAARTVSSPCDSEKLEGRSASLMRALKAGAAGGEPGPGHAAGLAALDGPAAS